MRFFRYSLLLVNLALIAINLNYIGNLTYSYFGFVPTEYIKYLFAKKTITIDGEEISLPPGYFLEDYDPDAYIGPIYRLQKYDFSSMNISLFRPLQECKEFLIHDYTKDLFEVDYSRVYDATQVLFSYYKFNNTGVAVRRSAKYFYHYQYQYSFDAVIPEKCMNIWAMSNDIDIRTFLEMIKVLAFHGEKGEFEQAEF